MGGVLPRISKREIDKRNSQWLKDKEQQNTNFYPYRHTTKMDVKPDEVKASCNFHFIRIPFPGKNQALWGFGTFQDLTLFKEKFIK